jgi:RHS repeat-associated protein
MTAENEIVAPQMSLPKGGGAIKGIGETFQPDPFTGTCSLAIPIYTTDCRDFAPKLTLNYSSGSGNGNYGIGCTISIPTIFRRTDTGIPRYDSTDMFVFSSEGMLTPKLKGQGGDERVQTDPAGVSWSVRDYLPKIEGALSKIEQWTNTETNESYWRVINRENVTSIFGKSEKARIANPDNPLQIAEWLIEESYDSKGNKVVYDYKQENDQNVTKAIYEVNRSYTAKRYIRSIKYGNYYPDYPSSAEAFAFEIIFNYGEYDLNDLGQPDSNPYEPTGEWKERADPYSSYRTGFEIRTFRLCLNVLMFHHFPAELGSLPALVRATQFIYEQTKTFSFMKSLTQTGYRRKPDGSYYIQPLPTLDLKYSQFKPPTAPVFRTLKVEGQQMIPGYFVKADFQPVDLYGEGLPGFLYSDNTTTLYYEPVGKGHYRAPASPVSFPSASDMQNPYVSLADLDSDGQLELIVGNQTRAGYYRHDSYGSWENFEPFDSIPTELNNPLGELVDLNGNGKADLLFVRGQNLLFYLSEGTSGFSAPQQAEREAGFPASDDGALQVTTFANIFGDGLSHRVRISDGQIEVWPNLGFGHFGEKVMLGGAPRFNQETSGSRIYIADVDGSGLADLIFAYTSRVEIYRNQSGNSFSEPITLQLPVQLSDIDQISFADILGHGATALVVSKMLPTVKHWFYEFSGEEEADGESGYSPKPYLLTEINNNLGAKVEIKYSTSTKYYLEDKLAGRPWVTRLPFPVQVVEKIIMSDQVSGSRQTSVLRYHDGYYDPFDKEFHGFGFVETWDTETFDSFSKSSTNPDFPVNRLNAELYVSPIYTKTWFCTGAYFQSKAISEQYRQEYFAGDPQAYQLPGNYYDEAILLAGAETLRQAYSVLTGKVMHAEVYGQDELDTSLSSIPYAVTESNYQVQLVQPLGDQQYASFYPRDRESIAYNYERNADDPRIEHNFTLAMTLFDAEAKENQRYLQETCTIFYARRPSTETYVYPEQKEIKATLQLDLFTRMTKDFRMIGVDYDEQTFEIGGLKLPRGQYYSFDVIKGLVDEAMENQIPYGTSFDPQQLQARPYLRQQSYFWNLEQTDALPLGQITERALLQRIQKAVFSEQWVEEVYGSKVNQQMLISQAGYINDGQGYWWNPGLVQYYFDQQQPNKFYLPYKTENFPTPPPVEGTNELFSRTTVAFDEPYYIISVELSKYVDENTALTTLAEIDYNVMQPWQLTDTNQIAHQVLFDPLSMVIATSIFKPAQGSQPREGDGDLSDYVVRTDATFESVLANKNYYLQEAASFFYYNLFAWVDGCAAGHCQPASYISLVRQDYVSDPAPGGMQTEVGYSDGFGREIEKKLEAEPGDAILRDQQLNLLRDEAGQPVIAFTQDRWIVSGRTVFNNKGKPAEEYLPYYSDTPYYETQQEIVDEGLVPPPKVIHYDPLLREIRIDTPKGFFSSINITAWEQMRYDEDDTVKDSPFYIKFFSNYPSTPTQQQIDEKDALDKAAKFYNTPTLIVLDNAGKQIRSIQNNLGDVPPDAFTQIVEGTSVTSEQLWNDLILNGYLETNTAAPVGTWVTAKFQPYTPGFVITLSPPFQQFAAEVTTYLLQSCLTTFYQVDIQGRVLETIDPRLYYSNLQGQTDCFSFSYDYGMGAEDSSYTDSADAGQRWGLLNVFESPIEVWDSRNQQISQTYDGLQRLLTTVVTDESGVKRLTEVITYGEYQPDAQQYNLRGEIYEYQDQAGVLLNKQYSIQSQVLLTTRQLRQDYKNEVNWYDEVPLEAEIFQTQYQYDAVNRLTSEITPDGSNRQSQYYVSGRLESIQVSFPGGTPQPFITGINYNANDQRLSIDYGNQSVQSFIYEDTTKRLVQIMTTRPENDKNGQPRSPVVQNVGYTYDPVGNVVLMRDFTQSTVFCYNQEVEARGDYTFDAIYRLIRATGRQHPGIDANTHINGFKQSIFAFLCPPDINDLVKLENYTEDYTYDNSNNLIKTEHRAVSASFVRNNPVSVCSNRLQSASYDGNGNQTQLSLNNSVGLVWDYRNNLARTTLIERPNDADDADYFVYDYNGQRIRKVIERYAHGGTITEVEETIYLGSYQVKRIKKQNDINSQTTLDRQSLRVMNGNVCVAEVYYWVTDIYNREVQVTGSRQIRYQIDDNLGSVSIELDQADASIISYEEYFPYGGTSVIAGNDLSQVEIKTYRYSGKECDDSTGLYYYGARYYATWMGRWLSPDPSGPDDGLNLYEFVGSNPVTYVDNNGRVKILHWNAENKNNVTLLQTRFIKEVVDFIDKDIDRTGTVAFLTEVMDSVTPATFGTFLTAINRKSQATWGGRLISAGPSALGGRREKIIVLHTNLTVNNYWRLVTPSPYSRATVKDLTLAQPHTRSSRHPVGIDAVTTVTGENQVISIGGFHNLGPSTGASDEASYWRSAFTTHGIHVGTGDWNVEPPAKRRTTGGMRTRRGSAAEQTAFDNVATSRGGSYYDFAQIFNPDIGDRELYVRSATGVKTASSDHNQVSASIVSRKRKR